MRRTVLLPFLAALGLQAQDPRPGIAFGGAQGMFIFTGDAVPLENGPVTGYLIERRTQATDAFKQVAELTPVGNAKALAKNLERAAKAVPYPVQALALNADSLWAMATKGERRHLGALYNDVPTLLACHLAWHDADARTGERYQYRITPIGGEARVSQWTTAGRGDMPVRATPVTSIYWEKEKRMELHYRMVGAPRASAYRLWRSDDDTPFEEVGWIGQAQLSGDTAMLMFADTAAARYRPLRYVLQAWDPFGHAAPPTDTLYTASLDPTQMPMPARMEARGDSSGRAIRIAWELPNAPLVKHLTLYRSTNSVDGFQEIATLASDRTVFIDEAVRPATPYFYHFVLEYKATHIPMRSHSFAATVYSQEAPEAPRGIHADVDEQQVTLRWVNHLGDAHSFLIYRAEQGAELKLISEPLPPVGPDIEMQWSEPVASLDADRMYHYAVRAVSTSHLHSGFSDTATVLSPNMATPPVPKDLRLRHDQEMLIIDWEDVSGETMVAGYQVLRTITPAKGRVTRDTLYVPVNFLVDTLKDAGTTNAYQVRSISLRGRHSAFAPEVRSDERKVLVSSPGSLNAQREDNAVALNWKAAHGEVIRYEVYRYTRGQEPVKVGSVPATQALALRDDKAPAGLLFYFVRAVDAAGNASAASREAVVE